MKIELELWHLISLLVTVIGAYAGIAKLLMAQYSVRIDEKFGLVSSQIAALGAQGAKYGEDVLRLERELAALRLEMMRDFTRREDHNQAIAGIRVALDNMSLRMEKALITGGRLDA
jgi:hypothetical protein